LPAASLVITTAHETPTYVVTSTRAVAAQPKKVQQLTEHGVRILTLGNDCDENDHDENGATNETRGETSEDSGHTWSVLALPAVLELLSAQGIKRLLIEGGSGIITSFLKAGLFDRLVLVTAPLIIGAGVAAVGDIEVRKLTSAIRLRPSTPRLIGPDLVWELYRE